MEEKEAHKNEYDYTKKIWIAVSIVALVGVLLLLLKATFNIMLLIFAGILIAVFFRGLSGLLQRKTKWNENICVGISIIGTLSLIIGFFWLIGSQIQSQVTELVETLPKTLDKAKNQLQESTIGDKAIENLTSDESLKKLGTFATSFFQSTFGAFGDLYVILFIGIFLTVSPKIYLRGVVELVPQNGQEKAKHILLVLGRQLRNWLKGKLLSMFVVFVLTAIGLAILGIPLWLVLALLAGLISFIPNFGPILALIPAVLVGLMDSNQTALLIAGL
jgi:predicted PurR-regulated permease PerM